MPKQRDWWCRLYSEVVDDDKLTWVADATGERRVVILGVWSGLLALANRSPERGALLIAESVPYTTPLLAHKLDMDASALKNILDAMCAIGLLEGEPLRVVSWDKRNPVSDDATVRQQEHRATPKPDNVVTGLSRDNVVTKGEDVTGLSRDSHSRCHNVVTPASISISTSISDSELGGDRVVGEGGGEECQLAAEPSASLDARVAIVAAAYERCAGLITPLVAEQIEATLMERPGLPAEHVARGLAAFCPNANPPRVSPGILAEIARLLTLYTAEEFEAAVGVAAAAGEGKCNLAYVRGTLEGRRRDARAGISPGGLPPPPWVEMQLSEEEYRRRYTPAAETEIERWKRDCQSAATTKGARKAGPAPAGRNAAPG